MAKKEYGYGMATRSHRIAGFFGPDKRKAKRAINYANASKKLVGVRKLEGPFRLFRVHLRAVNLNTLAVK